MNATQLRDAIKYAPKYAKHPEQLRGWWHSDADGLFYICAPCAARLMARGVGIGPAESVWIDRADPFGQCVCCEKLYS